MIPRRLVAILALAGLLGSLAASGQTESDAPRIPCVLLIGIDGCRPDALLAAKAPHLHGLIKTGAFSDKAQTGEITISGPGWSSMLTGVWLSKHGVRDNKFENANLERYPHFFRRLKQVKPKAYTVSLTHWPGIAQHIVRDADVSTIIPRDSLVVEAALKVLQERDPDVLFVHFDEVDGAGHKHGFHPKTPQYTRAIEQTDSYVGRLLKGLRERKKADNEDWLILVSTDHGGSEKSHGNNTPEHRTIFVIVNGAGVVPGVIEPPPGVVDVAATALAHLEIPLDPKWEFDGKCVGLKPRPKRN